jgi:hypothetical protein
VTYLIPLGLLAALFLAMPWLAVAFSRYCDAVNRFLGRRKPRTDRKRILIDPPGGAVILAARHLDATEGPVQIGSTVDASTRSAIDRVLDYVAKAHNSQTIGAPGSKEQQ